MSEHRDRADESVGPAVTRGNVVPASHSLQSAGETNHGRVYFHTAALRIYTALILFHQELVSDCLAVCHCVCECVCVWVTNEDKQEDGRRDVEGFRLKGSGL